MTDKERLRYKVAVVVIVLWLVSVLIGTIFGLAQNDSIEENVYTGVQAMMAVVATWLFVGNGKNGKNNGG